jgi:hypothetical protein
MRKRNPSVTDTTSALLTILSPDSTVPQLEEAADQIRAAHPERPRAYLVTLLATEALEARDALETLQRRVQSLEEAYATHLAGTCGSCFWRDGEMCLKFSEPHERFGFCRAGYRPTTKGPGIGRSVPLQIERSWTS